ncbi:MAG: pyruvate, phosphate dikinase [Actinobacteria bacterium]|nr:pyruvate, phosphate dikinase [Actinomycetota bacterium]
MTGTEAVSTIFVPYGQGRGRGLDEAELGAHGVEVDRLVALGLPVVPGVTVPVSHAASLTRPDVARAAVDLLQQVAGRRFGDPEHPLLIRLLASTPGSGAGIPVDLPGLGITAASAPVLDEIVGCEGAIYEVFAAVIRYVGEHGSGIPGDDFAEAEYVTSSHAERVANFLELCTATGSPFPDHPAEQLASAAEAALRRWSSARARRLRRRQGLPEDLGFALHVQAIRVGPPQTCGYGVAESRDPATGAFAPAGAFRRGVRRTMAGDRPGEPLEDLPGGRDLLVSALRTLELHMRGVAQVEFEIRDAELALLAARRVDRPAPRTAIRLALDLAEAGVIDDVTAVGSIRTSDIEALLHPQLQLTGRETEFARGLPAAAGAAAGRIALSSERAVEWSEGGDPVILVAEETSPGDLPGMLASKGIVTVRGGLAAHAAVVARGLGKPAVCGATTVRIHKAGGTVASSGQSLAEGELITVDGSTGAIYAGAVHVIPPQPGGDLETLLRHADRVRRLEIRANADNGRDAGLAIQHGAEGVGLCRTEHQFLGERLPLVRRYLLATEPDEEAAALVELSAAQKEDFLDLLTAVGNRPVTVRLLDAPLHEFLGEQAQEVNPMLGLRGVRLALMRTELYPAQARALFSAWVDLAATGITPRLEVMVPLVALAGELASAAEHIHRAAADVEASTGVAVPYTVGTMVETPRAALIADQLAGIAQFLSFGTNDLTQLTYGFSRDDVEAQLLTAYTEQELLPVSPFASLDPDGVGALIRTAIAHARRVHPAIKLGICGEHGGDPASIELCERLGLDYVSCSPSRVPGARLAAAHAAVAAAAR